MTRDELRAYGWIVRAFGTGVRLADVPAPPPAKRVRRKRGEQLAGQEGMGI